MHLGGLMLKGMVVQGLIWESYEAFLQPPCSCSKGSTTWLVICQGRKGQRRVQIAWWPAIWKVRGSEVHDLRYVREGKVTLGVWGPTLQVSIARLPGLFTLMTFHTWLIKFLLCLCLFNCLLYQAHMIFFQFVNFTLSKKDFWPNMKKKKLFLHSAYISITISYAWLTPAP